MCEIGLLTAVIAPYNYEKGYIPLVNDAVGLNIRQKQGAGSLVKELGHIHNPGGFPVALICGGGICLAAGDGATIDVGNAHQLPCGRINAHNPGFIGIDRIKQGGSIGPVFLHIDIAIIGPIQVVGVAQGFRGIRVAAVKDLEGARGSR